LEKKNSNKLDISFKSSNLDSRILSLEIVITQFYQKLHLFEFSRISKIVFRSTENWLIQQLTHLVIIYWSTNLIFFQQP